MKFDLNAFPPDIEIEPHKNGDKIVIKHRFFDAIERAALLEALSTGIGDAMALALDYIVAWTNVEDANGRPLPIQQPDTSGKLVSIVPDIIGRLPMSAQVEIWIQQMVANGFEYQRLEPLAREFLGAADSKRIGEAALAMGKPPETAPSDASAS